MEKLHTVDPKERLPNIVPLDFWMEYKPQKDGSMKEEERVKWVRRGSIGAETEEAVHRLVRDNGAIWQALKPYYDHWKAGMAAPINGTPLAAWPGATPQLVKALEPYHIKSVEDLAQIEDSIMNRAGIPGIRVFKSNAQSFLDAQKTTSVVAGEISTLRSENESLKTQLEELTELVKSMAAKEGVDVVDEPRRGPGRPRKVA